MREILFRGKQISNGEWVTGAFCPKSCDGPFDPMIDRPSIIKLDEPNDGFWFDVDPDTVGQYTGLQDKNGQRIFEGDIIRDGDDIYFCFWDGCNVEFGVKNKDLSFGIAYLPITEYEVIGNIHDNPELLEVQE